MIPPWAEAARLLSLLAAREPLDWVVDDVTISRVWKAVGDCRISSKREGGGLRAVPMFPGLRQQSCERFVQEFFHGNPNPGTADHMAAR